MSKLPTTEDSHPLHVLEELQASDIVPHCARSLPAVCRIPGRGAATLISIVEDEYGILLTTIHVVGSKQEAMGMVASFHDNDVRKRRIECRLRPDKMFYTPKPPIDTYLQDPNKQLGDEYLPYCIVACNLTGIGPGNIEDIAPIEFPITLSLRTLAKVQVNNIHLAVQFPLGGTERKYLLSQVESQTEHVCQYRVDEKMTGYVATGGPWFNRHGVCVGLCHHTRNYVQSIPITSIVQNLFNNDMLGHVVFQIHDSDPTLADKYDRAGELLPTPTGVFWKDVWDTWYEDDELANLVHFVNAFVYCPPILIHAFTQLTQPAFRDSVVHMAREGGIWPVLRIIDKHSDKQRVIEPAIASLGTASSFESNRSQLTTFEAIPIVLACMKGFPEAERIHQWSIFIILNLCEYSDENKTAFLSLDGFDEQCASMMRFTSNAYLQRWAVHLMALLVQDNAENEDLVFKAGGIPHVLSAAKTFSTNTSVMENVVIALQIFTKQSAQITEFLIQQNGLDVLIAAMELDPRNEVVMANALAALRNFLLHDRALVTAAVDKGYPLVMYNATCYFTNSPEVITNAVNCCICMGLDPLDKLESSVLLTDTVQKILDKV